LIPQKHILSGKLAHASRADPEHKPRDVTDDTQIVPTAVRHIQHNGTLAKLGDDVSQARRPRCPCNSD